MARRLATPKALDTIIAQALTGFRYNHVLHDDLSLDQQHCGVQYDVTTYLESGKRHNRVTRLAQWHEIPEEIQEAVKAIHQWCEQAATDAGLYEAGDTSSDWDGP